MGVTHQSSSYDTGNHHAGEVVIDSAGGFSGGNPVFASRDYTLSTPGGGSSAFIFVLIESAVHPTDNGGVDPLPQLEDLENFASKGWQLLEWDDGATAHATEHWRRHYWLFYREGYDFGEFDTDIRLTALNGRFRLYRSRHSFRGDDIANTVELLGIEANVHGAVSYHTSIETPDIFMTGGDATRFYLGTGMTWGGIHRSNWIADINTTIVNTSPTGEGSCQTLSRFVARDDAAAGTRTFTLGGGCAVDQLAGSAALTLAMKEVPPGPPQEAEPDDEEELILLEAQWKELPYQVKLPPPGGGQEPVGGRPVL